MICESIRNHCFFQNYYCVARSVSLFSHPWRQWASLTKIPGLYMAALCWLNLCCCDSLETVFKKIPLSCLVRASTSLLYPRSHKNSCYPLPQATPCQTIHEIFENVANASHTSMHVRYQCPRWMQSTAHNTESVHPCGAPFEITDCVILGNHWMVPGFLHERAKRARTHNVTYLKKKASQTCDRKTPITRIHNRCHCSISCRVFTARSINASEVFVERLRSIYRKVAKQCCYTAGIFPVCKLADHYAFNHCLTIIQLTIVRVTYNHCILPLSHKLTINSYYGNFQITLQITVCNFFFLLVV